MKSPRPATPPSQVREGAEPRTAPAVLERAESSGPAAGAGTEECMARLAAIDAEIESFDTVSGDQALDPGGLFATRVAQRP